jgi:PAS domain S-box-containing protein
MHRSLSICALWVLLSMLLVTGTSSAAERIKLVVGGDHENPPFEFLEDGKPTGFNVELMRAVADAIGADVEFRLGPWAKVRTELEQGKLDALAGMYYSPERSKAVDFSVPHTMVSAGLFLRMDSPIRSIDDIKGKEVIVQKGDVIDDYLHEKRLTSRIVEVKDPADVLRLLASGKHDAALMPSRFQGEYLKNVLGLSNIRAIATNLPQLHYCFAVRKGNSALRYRLDEALDVLKVNGRYKEIYEKWFGVYEKKSMWHTLRYFVWALALFAVLLAASFIWSWSLRREVRKRTAELREKDESLRFTQFAVDKTIDQAFWMTEDGRIFYVNDAACRALGYEREELLKLSIPDIDPIFQPEKFAEHWRDIQENGYATFETLHRSKDGRVYPVEIRANYVVFDGKEYNCAFATDISERKRAEEALRESEEKFRVLAETSPAATFLYQGERYVYVSPSAILLTGYSEQEFLQMHFWDFMHEDYRDIVKERGLSRLRGESVPSRYEIKIMAKNGDEKWLFVSGGSIEFKGRPAGIVTMFDITDRKRMEDELQHAYDDLEKRVIERTVELKRAKELLEEEINVRNRTERVITARLRLLEFAATHSLDELLEATIDEAEALTGSSIGFYHFLEADQETLSLQNWSTGTKAEFCRAEGAGLHYDISEAGVWVDCVRERRPVIHNNYASLPHRRGLPPGHANVIRELVLPVFRGDNIVAIIGVGNKPHDYTLEDVEAVSFLADLSWEIAERKRAEEALHLSQFCIDKAGIGIFQSDETGAIFSVNEHACKSLGYSREELCALSIFDIDPEITPERMLELKVLVEETGLVTHHTTHRRRDGTTFPVEIIANNLDFRGKSYSISFVKDITERKRAEEALRESESAVRRKLESILDPEGDIGELDLGDIIDAPQIQALMDDLHRNTGLKMSIIDLKGRVLVDVGWQEICLKYHRGHPETRRKCIESDTDLTVGVPKGEFKAYRCRNNMWHLVTPIFVGERHMGNLFMGQFFFENEELDYGLFRAQARQYGFPEKEYISALEAVPRHSEECVNTGKAFFLRLIDMFSKLSYGNIKLARLLTERDRLTETLQESEAQLKLAMDLAKLGAWEYDVSTGLFSFNDQFYGLYGTTAEREGGTLMPAEVYARKFIPPEESAVVANGIEAVRRNSYFQVEHRIIRADGEERFIVVRGEAVFNQEGRFVKIRGANQDITERKRAEEDLRKANLVVENSPVVLFRCTAAPGWPVELVSRNVIQFGYTPEEFLSGELTYSSIVYTRDLGKLIAETEEYAAKNEGHWFQEYRIVTKWGDIRWIIDETSCVRNEAGEISYYEGVVIDVTERRKAEEQLILQQMQLRELNRTLEERVREEVSKNREKDVMLIQQNRQAALGEVLDHIAHQWKQPLNAISLITYLLRDNDSLTMDEVNATVDKILGQVDHMSQTINVFRDFYRPDKEKSVFLVKVGIDRAISFIIPALQYESIKVEVDVDPKLAALGYPKEFAQVILNLLSNARDAFMEKKVEKPRLNLRGFADGEMAVVTVTDNAGGISEETIAKIFDMNFTTKELSGGTGIGLYMSKNIIERHMGGTLTAGNVVDGAQFMIRLATQIPEDI